MNKGTTFVRKRNDKAKNVEVTEEHKKQFQIAGLNQS